MKATVGPYTIQSTRQGKFVFKARCKYDILRSEVDGRKFSLDGIFLFW